MDPQIQILRTQLVEKKQASDTLYCTIKEAIATGATTITYGDKTVSYRSLAEMKDLVRMIEEELFPERRLRRRRLACIDRGYFSKR